MKKKKKNPQKTALSEYAFYKVFEPKADLAGHCWPHTDSGRIVIGALPSTAEAMLFSHKSQVWHQRPTDVFGLLQCFFFFQHLLRTNLFLRNERILDPILRSVINLL